MASRQELLESAQTFLLLHLMNGRHYSNNHPHISPMPTSFTFSPSNSASHLVLSTVSCVNTSMKTATTYTAGGAFASTGTRGAGAAVAGSAWTHDDLRCCLFEKVWNLVMLDLVLTCSLIRL